MPKFYLCLLLVRLWGSAQGHSVHSHSADDNNKPYLKIAPGNADFALRFYKVVASGAAQDNILFSPLSISTSLAMLSLGAKGDTLSHLLTGLGLNRTNTRVQEIYEGFHQLLRMLNCPKNEIELNIGDALFVAEELKLLQKFLHDAKLFFRANISHANFKNPNEAENHINSYIEAKTHGKLAEVVKGLDPETVMVIINYIFMKAYWKYPFNYEQTQENDFFVNKHTTVKVPMMFRNGFFKIYHDKDLSCTVVQLPYKGNASALFILPQPGKMKQLENALNRDVLLKWLNSLTSRRIELSLPRFSIKKKYVLKGLLRRLGISDIFTEHADLSGISTHPNLKVSKAIHQTYLHVYENGTEAAATTVLEITPHSVVPRTKFNRPFLMAVTLHETQSILFMGKINNPTMN